MPSLSWTSSDPAVTGEGGGCDSRVMADKISTQTDEADTAGQINTPPAQTADTDADKNKKTEDVGGAQISEAGGASLNEETNSGGADAVPDSHG